MIESLAEYVASKRGSKEYEDFTRSCYDEHPGGEFLYTHHVLASCDDAERVAQWAEIAMTSGTRSLREAVAANPHTPRHLLQQLLDDPESSEGVWYFLARNKSVDATMIDTVYNQISKSPQPSGVVPSIAVALATRPDINATQLAQLDSIGHPRLKSELSRNLRVRLLRAERQLTPWFMTPLRPRRDAESPIGREVRWVEQNGVWSVEIEVNTPRHGRWTVVLSEIEWERCSIDNERTAPGSHELQTLGEILKDAAIICTGVETNNAGSVTSTDPDGVCLIAESRDRAAVVHGKLLEYRA